MHALGCIEQRLNILAVRVGRGNFGVQPLAELRARLDSMVSEAMRRSVRWPKAPNALSNAIRRMTPDLRAAGIELQFSRNDEQGRRIISVLGAAQVRKTPSVVVSDRQ